MPGGKVRLGEPLADAVAREVREETGIDVEPGAFAGFLEWFHADSHFVILDFFATADDNPPIVAGDDVDEVRWVPLDAIAQLKCTPRFVETLTAWGVIA